MWYREFAYRDPVDVAERLRRRPGFAFLDSAMSHGTLGRYSYLAAEPFGIFTVKHGDAFWQGEPCRSDALHALGALLDAYRTDCVEDFPPFQGGALGYFSYDFAASLETMPQTGGRGTICDDARLAFYDTLIAFDTLDKRMWLISTGWPAQEPNARKRRAEQRLNQFEHLIAVTWPQNMKRPHGAPLRWVSNFSRQSYCEAVETTRRYILSGDIYQANIAQRFHADLPSGFDPWQFYRALRLENPATFAAYLDCGTHRIASSSPERFLKLSDDLVEARPIKGTAKRDLLDPNHDKELGKNLLDSEKDRAENVMIVDLLRNDLSKICKPGSVEVPQLCELESYASVHHLVSAVTGRLRSEAGAMDLIKACFPGGSITGAPKYRAMEIIAELEGAPRELFCGSIGYLGFDGSMDMNIAIRTAFMNEREAVFHAGGGITMLSDPLSEYEETLAKAARIFSASEPPEQAEAS